MAAIKILTSAHVNAFKKFGRQDHSEAKVILKLFFRSETWYITEYDPSTGIAFGFTDLGCARMAEQGSIDLYELININRRTRVDPSTPLTEVKVGGVDCPLGVERDIRYPIGKVLLREVIEKVKNGQHV